SVINQTYSNIEYILIDGASKDSTVDIIKEYEPLAKDKGIDYKWISESDNGIYEAMNKGLEIVIGEWVNFMNCGDVFYDNSILSKIFIGNTYDEDIIYGSYKVKHNNKIKDGKSRPLDDIWKGNFVCHQSVFVKSPILRKYKFNEAFRISADADFFYRAYKDGLKFNCIDVCVSVFLAGGISDSNRIEAIVEDWFIVDKNLKVNMFFISRIFVEIHKIAVKWLLRKIGV
ncbi:MAG: glycosyltransferase family 2 protein, partial [Alphaproteobacteria bacterium]